MNDRTAGWQNVPGLGPKNGPATAVAPEPPKQPDKPDAEGEQVETSHGWERGARSRPPAIEFRRSKESWYAGEYALICGRWWNPAGEFTLEFTTGVKVTVRGTGLRLIYERLLQNRVYWIAEQGDDAVTRKAAPPTDWVESITVDEPKEEEEAASSA